MGRFRVPTLALAAALVSAFTFLAFEAPGGQAASSDVQIVALSCDSEPEYVRIRNFGATQSLSGFRLQSDSTGGTQDYPLVDFVGSIGTEATLEFQSGPGSADNASAGIYRVTGNPLL